MTSTSQRFSKVGGLLLALAAIASSGCAVTTGGAPGALAGPGYTVCSGGHASRFPQREEVGRTCRPASSLQAHY